MRPLDEGEWGRFIGEGTPTGKLSLVLPSGRPTVVPVWTVCEDDGVLRFNAKATSAKALAMANDPRVCILFDLEHEPYGFVKIDATATFVTDPDEVVNELRPSRVGAMPVELTSRLSLGVWTRQGLRHRGKVLARRAETVA